MFGQFGEVSSLATDVARLNTGIRGLDEKMQGGLVKNSVTLITGKTGTGKTAFCTSFLYAGLLRGEPCIYITTEERVEDIKQDILSMFGWDLDRFERDKILKFMAIRPTFPGKMVSGEDLARFVKMYVFDMTDNIEKSVVEIGAKRLVLDSVSIVEMFIKDEYLSRVALMQLLDKLKQLEVTSVIAGTIPEESAALSGGGIIEYIADGIVKLDFVPVAEEFKRTLTIRKMRRTDHSIYIHPFEISKEGIKLMQI
jgi:circadian clock protein KaiC